MRNSDQKLHHIRSALEKFKRIVHQARLEMCISCVSTGEYINTYYAFLHALHTRWCSKGNNWATNVELQDCLKAYTKFLKNGQRRNEK